MLADKTSLYLYATKTVVFDVFWACLQRDIDCDDCYLGPYLGKACHVGMDVNHPKGSPLFAPIEFDTQAYFNSLVMGHENNRWRGIRRWKNGDVWALQTHHLIELLVPENTPLKAGTRYATTAGVHTGSHQHTHFEFKIGHKNPDDPLPASDDPASIACPVDFDDESRAAREDPEVLHLDPWIVFWQIFEDHKARRGAIRAEVKTPDAMQTGRAVAFSGEGSRGVEPLAGKRVDPSSNEWVGGQTVCPTKGGRLVDLCRGRARRLRCGPRRPATWPRAPATVNSWAWPQTIDSNPPRNLRRRPGGTLCTK